jgi:acyl-CoA thioesterase
MWGSADGADPARADLSVEIVFGALDASGSPLERPRFPRDAGTPETAVPREELMGNRFVDIPFHTQTDWRLSVGAFVPDAAPTDPRAVSWMRMRQSPMTAEGAWDPAVLAVPGDMLGPAVVAGLGGSAALFVVTLQLSMQWFAPLRTEWVLQDSMVVRGGNGFVTGIVELWSQDEQLVGFGTQTALMRPFERVVAEGLSGTESQG